MREFVALALCLALPAEVALAHIYVLGDLTPIYSLMPALPEPAVQGNQTLFLRFAGLGLGSPPMVLVYSSDRYDTAKAELEDFYLSNSVGIRDETVISSSTLEGVDLLILVVPDQRLDESQITAIRRFIAKGQRLLILGEPVGCDDSCSKNINELLVGLGSSVRVNKDTLSGGRQWGLLADRPLMRNIGSVRYGATLSVVGGTALMYETGGLPMLAVDEHQGASLVSFDSVVSSSID